MEYKIVYSGRKTIALCIKDEGLVVKAPYGTSDKKIRDVIEKHRSWVEKHLAKREARVASKPPLTDEKIAELKKAAKEILPKKTEYFANVMGLKYGRITITSAKTRFGSCSSKGNVSFSYRLMLYPDAAIDYVVVHELAHLVEMNHSKRLYAVVERVLPDYKMRAKLLKQ